MDHPAVLITGATGNLGSAVLSKFSSEGYTVAALDSHRSAPGIATGDTVFSYPVDLSNEAEVKNVLQTVFRDLGHPAAAVLTVGGFAMGSMEDTGIEELERMIRINFLTAYTVSRELLGWMERQGGGQLVFIGAVPAIRSLTAGPMIAYALSKSLLIKLAEVINAGKNQQNVYATVVIPGVIDTPQNRRSMPDADHSAWQSPDWIAERIYSLFTPEGEALRGSVLEI
jgi:NAD(P)-dependent dehydrogenase (short-subunit alcohol dehydrogenase family)